MQEQKKHLQSKTEAHLQEIKDDHLQQLSKLRETLEQKEKELQQRKAREEAEIRRKLEEAQRLQQQLEAAARRHNDDDGMMLNGLSASEASHSLWCSMINRAIYIYIYMADVRPYVQNASFFFSKLKLCSRIIVRTYVTLAL